MHEHLRVNETATPNSTLFSAAFGKALKNKRTALNLSQEELGFRSGLDRTYISGIERGTRNPTLLIANRIAEALAIPLSVLIAEAEKPMQEGGASAV
ncbi:helix-turn-helix transcriptional regulator [Hymenobacter sp. M29]|uniref:Helix-turn-helix transcriptional regulator n=1 Tax=Hymenobacter mellowenesis TaxID=3063995 RepID=A0ABT9AEL7_9BACT|nr:helix-turn-helix transcriptional regulator [Hymenobacter sp. M29]MDO7847431.1 helix-turn-helix transcriptional regulator [Hymenobacter sp. M29]